MELSRSGAGEVDLQHPVVAKGAVAGAEGLGVDGRKSKTEDDEAEKGEGEEHLGVLRVSIEDEVRLGKGILAVRFMIAEFGS